MTVDREREFATVVVGLDGSATSTAALRWGASQLAPGGVVHAVHVVVPAEELALDAALGDSVRLRHHREAELRKVWLPKGLVDVDPPTVEIDVREGAVADQLRHVARETEAQMIVVGHHEHARVGPQLVGHVTAKLLRTSEIPVAIVPVDWVPDRTEGRPTVVGVGVSRGTRAALKWAMSHPAITRHGLVLAHAHGPRTLFRTDGWLDVLAFHLDPTVLPDWVELDLMDLAEQLRAQTGSDVEVAVSVQPGRVGARLVEAGEEAGLLVIGRGEPPFIRSHKLAPYLKHAIAHAPCPIVVVPAPDD